MDWNALKACLFDAAKAQLEAVLSSGVTPLYAAAFFASYREQESVIGMPSFAVNSLAALDEDHPKRNASDECFYGVKWNPVDWHWTWDVDEYGGEQLAAYETEVEGYANRGSVAMWDSAEKRFMTVVAQAAADLRKYFAKDPRVAKDFVVFFHDEYGGDELASKSIPKRLFLQLFPELDATEQERRRIATLPLAEQALCYTQHLNYYEGISCEEAERWLIACGAPAIPALLGALEQRQMTWKAAMILGLIGEPEPKVIAALRHVLMSAKDVSAVSWSASALGYLGDVEWLLALAESPKFTEYAVDGCCAALRAFRNRGAKPVKLDYAPVERLLAAYPHCRSEAEETLKPGSSYCHIGEADVPEAVRGLASAHAVVRRHAVCVLDNRAVGEAIGLSVVEPIRDTLTRMAKSDEDESVRYLAGLTLSSMKKWRLR